jgi:hypothetical protein
MALSRVLKRKVNQLGNYCHWPRAELLQHTLADVVELNNDIMDLHKP